MSNDFQRWCPTDIFSTGQAGAVCTVKDVKVALTAATNNQTVIAAVTGKSIVVLHGSIFSVAAVGTIVFKSASGGTHKKAFNIPASVTANPNVDIPGYPWGNFRTVSGEGLFADTGGADIIVVSLTYIEV